MEKFSWKNEAELMARLGKAQNRPVNQIIDIMTFAGFCSSRADLLRHVEHYEKN